MNITIFEQHTKCVWTLESGPRKGEFCLKNITYKWLDGQIYDVLCQKHEKIFRRRNWEDK